MTVFKKKSSQCNLTTQIERVQYKLEYVQSFIVNQYINGDVKQ
jgi:hypothetical protein